MMDTLVQARWPMVRTVRLGEFAIIVSERTIGHLNERSILYEELQLDRIVRSVHVDLISGGAAALAALLGFAVIAANPDPGFNWDGALFWATCAVIGGVFCWLRSGERVQVPVLNAQPLVLASQLPSKPVVDDFLAALTKTSKNYVITKFGPIRGQGPREEQINRLRWLRDRNFINDQELQARIADLGPEVRGEGGQIGFRS